MATFAGPDLGLAHARTEDCGRTWSVPTVLATTRPGDRPDDPVALYNPEVLVLPDGDLLATWFASPVLQDDEVPHWIEAARSVDGGRSWSAPVTVTEYVPGNQATDPDSGEPIKTHYPWPSIDVAPNGTVHLVHHHLTPTGEEQIRLVSSADGGVTWAPSRVLTEDPAARPFLPIIAVAGNGALAVTFYDMRNDVPGDDELTVDTRIAVSRDGGDTWRERSLSDPFDMRGAMNKLEPSVGLWLGDYHGLDGLPHGFAAAFGLAAPHAVHGANDVFFTRVPAPPDPRHGTPGR